MEKEKKGLKKFVKPTVGFIETDALMDGTGTGITNTSTRGGEQGETPSTAKQSTIDFTTLDF